MDEFGYTTALKLIEKNNHVCGVDKNPDIINKIEDNLSYTVCVDIQNETTLESLHLDSFDVFIISLRGNFETTAFIAGTLKKKYPTTMILCRITRSSQKKILNMLGIEYTIFPEQESAENTADNLSVGRGYFTRITEHFSVSFIPCKKSWINKRLEDIEERYEHVKVLGIKEESEIISYEKNYIFLGDEIVTFAGKNENLRAI
jgi:trk system potassium uptake protein TrkA